MRILASLHLLAATLRAPHRHSYGDLLPPASLPATPSDCAPPAAPAASASGSRALRRAPRPSGAAVRTPAPTCPAGWRLLGRSTCVQRCPSDAQTRDSNGRCRCGQGAGQTLLVETEGGDHDKCGSRFTCVDNVCVDKRASPTLSFCGPFPPLASPAFPSRLSALFRPAFPPAFFIPSSPR